MQSLLHNSSSVESSRRNSISASPLLDRLDAVLEAHHKLTGKRLDWREAVRRLDRLAFIDGMEFMPRKAHEVAIGAVLIGQGYSEPAILGILDHVEKYGTAVACPDLDESDVESIEAILPPRVADWHRTEAASSRWTVTESSDCP